MHNELMTTMEMEDLRVRLRPGLKQQLDRVLEAKRVSQVVGVNELVSWFVTQDGMLQSLILGQVDAEYEGQVAKMILSCVLKKTATTPPNGASGGRPKGGMPTRVRERDVKDFNKNKEG